jgi:release factor glutamine methyltransferase
MTVRRPDELISEIAAGLPPHEALRLLIAATGRPRRDLLWGEPVDAAGGERFKSLVARRAAGEPLQYLEGTVEFGPLELAIDDRALIPRPETEQLWELAASLIDRPRLIMDMCTGSGNLALALKYSFPDADVHGCDTSAAALDLASENAARTGLDVTWWRGDLFAAPPQTLQGRIDLLVSNPPYIAAAEHRALPVDVREHEPTEALVAGPLGTEFISRIGDEVVAWLAPGGVVVCEIGERQGKAALTAFLGMHAELRRDLAGRDRFVVARHETAR